MGREGIPRRKGGEEQAESDGEGENLRKHGGLSRACLLTEERVIGGAFQEVVIKRTCAGV